MSAASGMTSSSWTLDSGATHHMTSDATQLVDLRPVRLPSHIHIIDGTLLSITQSGRLTSTSTAHSSLVLPMFIMFLVLLKPYFLVSQLIDYGLTVTFTSSACVVQDLLTGRRIETGRRVGGLYYLEHLHLFASASSASVSAIGSSSAGSFDR